MKGISILALSNLYIPFYLCLDVGSISKVLVCVDKILEQVYTKTINRKKSIKRYKPEDSGYHSNEIKGGYRHE